MSLTSNTCVNESTSVNCSTTNEVKRNEDLVKIEIGVQAAIVTMTLLSNSLVLIILMRQRTLITRMQKFIANLSIADILVGIFNTLPQMIMDITEGFYVHNDFLCRFVKYMQVMVMYLSTYVLVTATIDRYISICHPMLSLKWTNRRVVIAIRLAWALSFVFAIPQAVIFKIQKHPSPGYNVIGCYNNFSSYWILQAYVTWITFSIFFVPLCIIIFSYVCILRVIWGTRLFARHYENRHSSTRHKLNGRRTSIESCATPKRSLSRSKMKTIKLTLAVVVCFVVCWSPWFICQLWAVYDENAPYSGAYFTIILLLASLNSCTNPWIYLAFSCFSREKRSSNNSATATQSTSLHLRKVENITGHALNLNL